MGGFTTKIELMFKRTAGNILLVLLIITGMGSRNSTDTLSARERRVLITSLKDTKTELLKQIEGLSEEQLNFKAAPDRWSVKECIKHLALSEEALRKWTAATMAETANPERRSTIKLTDAQVLAAVADRSKKAKASETIDPKAASWATTAEAVDFFKEHRASLLKYVKTTTEDMRNHVTDTQAGPLDAYQLLLLISAHTTRHTLQIVEVKKSAGFPKQHG
jgi:hypothetical protein